MYTFAGTTEEGRLRVLVGMTAAELTRIQENEGIVAINPQPSLWWAVTIESPGKPTVNAHTFMRSRYGVTRPQVVTIPPEDVTDLLKCEQRVFHCSPSRGSDLIVFVEKTEESLKASWPLFGIEAAADYKHQAFSRFNPN